MQVKAKHVVKALNNLMEARGSIIRFEGERTIDIVLKKDPMVKSFVLNPTDEFYEELQKNLKEVFGIEGIKFNNTWSCFWHKDIVAEKDV